MRVASNAVAGVSLPFLILVVPGGLGARVLSSPVPTEQNSAPPSYTFHMDVVMAMRHFPWLHFRLQGTGDYQPGMSYVVHFNSVPWFIPKVHKDADLTIMDPLMWPRHYTYSEIGQRDGANLFELHALNDPGLRSATVAVGTDGCTREVDATYSDGTHVDTKVNSSVVGGFMLPTTMTATIDEPHIALSGNATFKDYTFATTANSNAP